MPRDQVRATPRNSALGALADFLAQSYSPERTQQMQGVAKFLDMPAISETIDRLSYDPSGRSLFTGAGGLGGTTRFRPEVLDAAMAVAPGAGALGKLAAQGTMAAGRAGARLAERAVPQIMGRGGMGLLDDELGAAFGVFPQMKPRRRFQDREASANVPLDITRGRLAGLLGLLPDTLNFMGRSPMPTEVFGETQYEPAPQLPYGSEYYLENLPLKPTSRIGEVAGQAGAFVPLNPMPAARAVAAGARALGPTAVRMGEGYLQRQGLMPQLDVYHGSPHKFDRFDASKIGTGEGAQAYGHGIYTAEAPAVAKGYQLAEATYKTLHGGLTNKQEFVADMLSQGRPEMNILDLYAQKYGGSFDDAMKDLIDVKEIYKKSGNLYKVDLPDEQIAKMLDWDRPLSEQPNVIKALKGTDYEVGVSQKEAEKIADMRLRQEADEWAEMTGGDPVDYSNNVDWEKYVNQVRKESGRIDSNITGKDLHSMVMRDEGYRPDLFDSENYQVGTSETLRGMGIPGIKYLDANSRGGGQGTRNFVTFPGEEKNLTILERNGQPMVAPAVPEEHKMLQGFYRGYAGENLDTPELFVSPQKRIADYYADKRARQTGAEPHAEMVLMDPFAGETYGHSTMGSGAKAPMFTNAKKIKLEDIEGRTQLYQSGGVVKLLQGMLVNSGEKAITAAQRAAAGRAAAELIKSQEQVKASEALGQLMEKGFKRTTTTQADRTRVGGGNIGGAPFPALSQADPAYAGKVWGVMDEGAASRLKNLTTPDTAWTTMLGSAIQLKTNPVVFDKLKRGFIDSMKQGNLSDELAGKINHNLSLTFGEGVDIRDPGIWKLADTFYKRDALADAMMGQGIAPGLGGVALGGEKSGRGVIFRPTDILKRETEPSLLHTQHGGDVPTYAAGPRLFSLEPESMYRPDLHPGFPTLIKGEDLNYNMMPTPTEVYLPDWHARFKTNNPERKAPGYYDLALGVEGEGLPSQALNNEYIRHLLREGFAEGGAVHMDEGGAAFGVFPQMKARRAQQDREAAANAPLSALRGWAAGTAGLPGDIEGLARAGISQLPPQLLTAFPALRAFGIGSRADPTPQLPTTEFYNEYLPGAQLNETPTGKAFTTAGNLLGGTGATSIARLGIKSAKATGQALGPTAVRIGEKYLERQGLMPGVIKMPGGNFLTGRTEKDLQPLKTSTFVGETPAQRISKHEELLKNPALSQDQRDRVQRMLDVTKGEAAIDNWVDSNLTNYVKKQMGTADDPVRLMFDKRAQEIDAQYAKDIEKSERIAQRATGESDPRKQANLLREAERIKAEANTERQMAVNHISHKPALLDEYLHEPLSGEQVRRTEDVKKQRRAAGFPEEGLGQSPMAKAWEISSDEVIASHRAGDIQGMPEKYAKFTEAENKMRLAREEFDKSETPFAEQNWLDYLKAEDQFHASHPPMMDHYMDLGRQNPFIAKLDPNTSLYSTYTQNLGFDHIMDVLREDVTAGRIRPEQLNKFSITDAIRRTSEYDRDLAAKMNASRAAAREGLPTYREYPEGYKWIQLNKPGSFAQESEAMGHSVRGYEPPKGHPDWTEASGDAGSSGYGHGGWEAIKSGKAKVYSLVDSKGAPHATVEVEQIGMTPEQRRYKIGFLAAQLEKEGKTAEDALRQAEKIYPEESKESISQIKGKGNRAPNEEYLPYIQDFVKGSNWSDVNAVDLRNTGLRPTLDAFNSNELKMIQDAGLEVPIWASGEDLQRLHNSITPEGQRLKYDSRGHIVGREQEYLDPTNYAQGGLVSNHFDPIKIKQIIAGLDDDYDPENIQQIIAQRESAYA